MGIQINGNTNNINAGIGSLSIEDLREIDIVGVATASNFKTGSSNLHSTGLTVGNALVHSTGINVGTGATVHCPATNVLTFGTNSNERLRITSGGDIQVDNGNLHIDDNGEFAIFEQDTALAMTNSSKISMDFASNVARIRSSWNGSGSNAVGRPLAFYIGSSEKLRITSSGYVGVKRSTPLANLHTTNNELAIGANPTGAAAPNATYDGLVVDGEEASLINIRSCATGNISYGRVSFSDDVRSRGYIDYRHRDGAGGALEFMNFAVAGSERIRIISSGEVSIGGFAPTAGGGILQIAGGLRVAGSASASDTTTPYIYRTSGVDNLNFATSGVERLRIGSNGVATFTNDSPPATGVGVLFVTDGGSATTLGTAATLRVANDGGNSAYSVFEAQSGSGSIRLANDGKFYVSGASTFSDDIRVDTGTSADGIVGKAYGTAYFGLKQADQSSDEYMMISNNNHTYISCTTGNSIYIRPSANSSTHETVFAHDTTTFKTHIMLSGHALQRSNHHTGHLEGSYNNVGANSSKSNPIYTIGSNYNPGDNDLGNMYGIGYSHGNNASFISMTNATSWGLYVAADGDARVFLGGSTGKISITSTITQNASDVRLKTNIKVIDNPIEKIKKIRGVTFDWVDNITSEYDFHPDSMHETGVIAQEIQEVIPDAVATAPFNGNYTKKSGTDNNFLTVKNEKIIPLCIEAIKELSAQVELLKSKVATLEGS